jgi:hypothetical protein
MSFASSDLNTKITIMMNKKCCPSCFKQYSPQTILFEILETLQPRSTVFPAKEVDPMYIREGSHNRLIGSKPRAVSYEPSLCIRVTCQCGHSYTKTFKNE